MRVQNASPSWLGQAEYETLVELLVFHGLVPLGEYTRALSFLRKNQRLGAPKRKAFVQYVRRLKGERFTSEVDCNPQATPLAGSGTALGGRARGKTGGATQEQ